MSGNRTTLKFLEDGDKDRDFYFDFSFWSHDDFIEEEDGRVIFCYNNFRWYPAENYQFMLFPAPDG